ncbi:MAG: V-type ATP synthase subunit D [Candidatus Omnitrophica bacterium]|nr:V-type ATP synthase subunit D [Candidatus Omnitrophota bacterium]
MAKIKFTKGELKRQRDALRQYERYLPTLQLKKQQLQLEILQEAGLLAEKDQLERKKAQAVKSWIGLLAENAVDIKPWLKPLKISTSTKNVAGTDIAIFESVEFPEIEYDLFSTPFWLDFAIENLRSLVSLREEIRIIEEGINILKRELRIVSQRVNLFEKIKIPQAREAIHRIKIYIGDQMANAVGRSKMAKRKLEKIMLKEAAV